jgi:AcrR family transcriptional regulator
MPELDEAGMVVGSEVDTGPRSKILAAGRLLITTNGADFTTQAVIRQAGVALQTFYRYFGSKDQLLLALIGELISEHCADLTTKARNVLDPTARLEMYVRTTLSPIHIPDQLAGARFITAEHWRLHETFPSEVWAATQPFSDLIRAELVAGSIAGTLSPRNPERDAWLMTKTIIGAYHHCAFQPEDPALTTIDDDVWYFCLAAAGGSTSQSGLISPSSPPSTLDTQAPSRYFGK